MSDIQVHVPELIIYGTLILLFIILLLAVVMLTLHAYDELKERLAKRRAKSQTRNPDYTIMVKPVED